MIVKRQTRPLPGTRLAASRDQRHWASQSRRFWADVARYANEDRARGWPVKTFQPALKTVRMPYTRDYVDCVCGAADKDDCCCIRETMRSNVATSASDEQDAVRRRIGRALEKLYPNGDRRV